MSRADWCDLFCMGPSILILQTDHEPSPLAPESTSAEVEEERCGIHKNKVVLCSR